MRGKIIAAMIIVCGLFGAAHWSTLRAQRGTTAVDWKAELAKARNGIEKNPKSAFWHNQAGVAYDALGDFESAVKELRIAQDLDSTNPIHGYALYALYKRKNMHTEQRQVLLDVLEIDSKNPLGRFEFAALLEAEAHLSDAVREYQVAKRLVEAVEGHEYIDSRGNPYEIEFIRTTVDKRIDRVVKLQSSKGQRK